MAAVGDSVLSTTLQVMFDRIAPSQKFLLDLFPGNKKLQLKRLMRVLQIIPQVLQDAENKQGRSPSVKTWFNGLKHAVYQADDVLDEINTERLRINLELSNGNYLQGYTDFSDQIIGELSPRLEEICDALERKVLQIGVLGLRILYGKQKREDKLLTTSEVEQSGIFGRDAEKEKIIQMVLSGERAPLVSVIPIIGMGGIGKTTLAQLVYNDERVKNQFETRAWVCVSEEFDVYRATKELLMEVNSSVIKEKDDLNCLQVKLQDSLKGKRFIIIFDDIWNDNYNDCQSLMIPLSSGSRGSKIIVTTRNENIALMLQNEPFHRLKPISDDQSWSLFKFHVLDDRARPLLKEFEAIGRTIVEKCKGLPLAIKTVAGALRSKHNICEWRDIASNDNWMIEGDILPALSLSYKLLPSHLKCCFAFCAVFPKDVPFDKNETALLWMANDLVQPSSQKVAQNYFEELRSRSFFEIVEMGNFNEYLMHDLVNDLARHVNRNFCARIEDNQLKDLQLGIQGENNLPVEVLHFSYLSCHMVKSKWLGGREVQRPHPSCIDQLKRFRVQAQVQGLRTFLPIHTTRRFDIPTLSFSDILPKLRHIRAVSLSKYEISVIPYSIGHLKHLRFLNLAMTSIKKLPNDITKCLNLQTLILYRCRNLEELPEDMGLLINLLHLDLRSVEFNFIAKMQIWLNILKDMQNLSIVVNEIHGRALEQLDKLQPGQSLIISELDNAVTVEMARNAQLKNKNCIERLTLQWSSTPECSEDELNIFAELIPHPNIRELSIKGYGGITFSNWLGDSSFCNLESLILRDCENCIHLPPLGQLTGLKELKIYSCNKLKSLPELPSLRILDIIGCPEMECFPDGGLPLRLEDLWIDECKKLMKFPRNWGLQRLPCLTDLGIRGIEDKLFPEEGLLPASLKSLWISDCPNLEALNHKGFQDISSLQTLVLEHCLEVRYLPEIGLPSTLCELKIYTCPKLKARIEREKGEEWPKVSHVPYIQVDARKIY